MNYSFFNDKETVSCIDAGSENCPCYLALTGDCMTCSRLSGKDYCDCRWSGVCIYNEFIQGGKRINNPRRNFKVPIAEKRIYEEDLVVYVLDVGKGFAMKASKPGTYVFIKGQESSEYYEVPISVMKSDIEKGQIYLAVKVISAKTKALLSQDDSLIIRGPYRSGIQGMNNLLKKLGTDSKILIISKGIGIAPSLLAAKYLCLKCPVDLFIDSEKISKDFISDYINDGWGKELNKVKYMSLSQVEAQKEIEDQFVKNHYTALLILTSDYYIDLIGRMAKAILPKADLGISNNVHMCCGEGLCGACAVETEGGEVIKMCKCKHIL